MSKETKEEALRIIELFEYPNIKSGLMSSEVKQCALICLDEKIKTANKYSNNHLGDIQEFQELKEYIQNNY